MNEMHEEVGLPDPSEKALLHPTDIAQARPAYLRGWRLARLGSIPVAVALGAAVWLLSGNLLAAILAATTTFAIGIVTGRWFMARAWDFVPRRRKLTTGATTWELAAASIDAIALVIAAIMFVLATRTHAIPLPVVAFAIGSVVAIALLQGIELAILGSRAAARTDVMPKVVMMGAVVASCVIALAVGIGSAWNPPLVGDAFLGAGTVLLAQALASAFRFARKPGPAVKESS